MTGRRLGERRAASGERKIMIAALRYQHMLVKTDETWRFAERRLYVRWTETSSRDNSSSAVARPRSLSSPRLAADSRMP